MKDDYWIRGAIEHKGSLTKWAKRHGFVKGGKIELAKAERYAKRHGESHRIKQINLARTLKRLNA